MLAVMLGPNGYPSIGHFQNFVQITSTFASGAINTGVTKYTAEHHQKPLELAKLWQTALRISLFGGILATLIIILFSGQLSIYLLGDISYKSVFILFAAGLEFLILNSLLLAILNGKSEIKIYVKASIVGSVISLILSIALAKKFGLWGALSAISLYQSLSFFVTFLMCKKLHWFRLNLLWGKGSSKFLKKLKNYTLMALVSGACAPLSTIMVRHYLIDKFDLAQAGYWEAMTRLASGYMLIFTSILGVYYLPKFSQIKSSVRLKQEIYNGLFLIVPCSLASCLIIFIYRNDVINILFSKNFLPMEQLFSWFLIGDIIKICSWLLAYIMLGKSMTKSFVFSEIFFSATYVLLTVYFTKTYGLKGTGFAYTLNYFFYFVAVSFIVKNYLQKLSRKETKLNVNDTNNIIQSR